jgi:ABC-type cobalamin/Fe3+-siderophores transport system ATPase subunit
VTLALLSNDYQPTKEDLVRQRLKTVKAVIASAMDELEFELLHQRNSAESASGEDQLLVLATKLDQLNELL